MISVVIATRDRAEQLDRTLQAFCALGERTAVAWELVVVDNGSRDATPALLARRQAEGRLPLRLAHVGEPGLSRARNAGLQTASHDILAFTDDDCLPAPDWLDRIAAHFDGADGVDLLGGRVLLADNANAAVGIRPFDDDCAIDGLSAMEERIIGCNLAVRRAVFADIGLFDLCLGAGSPLASAEEFDLVYRALMSGWRIGFGADAIIRHAHGRSDSDDLRRLHRGYRLGRAAFYGKHFFSDPAVRRHAYWEARSLLLNHEGGNEGMLRVFVSGVMRGMLLSGRHRGHAAPGHPETAPRPGLGSTGH